MERENTNGKEHAAKKKFLREKNQENKLTFKKYFMFIL